ncbi:hypothetical protein MLD38_035886 [Melastoma candidum]|uniref:Uncharacterized protein n=1 Tax=Melastoma candidum TaxID=119954 RepID=A0ACB9LHZ4_9MYRT|nr:hypothetical protein MLD38_035886 [Melastoma candidum]
MGLKGDDDDEVPLEDSVKDSDAGGKVFPCSICLDSVTDDGNRSWAKLQCGHRFHLDCIGSAFNVKGAMQCPNCRKVEKGQWLYGSRCRPLSDFSMEDWTNDDDLYDMGYSEMSFGVHWCPFGQLARLPSLYEDIEIMSTAYNGIQHAFFAEHSAVSSSTHYCPYIAYFGSIHPSTSNSSGSAPDGTNIHNHWNGPLLPGEVPTSYPFQAVDVQYHGWDQPSSFSNSSYRRGAIADQPPVPPPSHRSGRTISDVHRAGSLMHPFPVGHSSGGRSGSSVPSSFIPPYPGSNARARNRVQALQAYYQQQQQPSSHLQPSRTPIVSATRRSSSSHRGMQMGLVSSSPEHNSGFYIIPTGSSGPNYQEPENPSPVQLHGWERDPSVPFQLTPAERDSTWPYNPLSGRSELGVWPSSFHATHGSERTP